MNRISILFIVCAFTAGALSQVASAHTTGVPLEKSVGEYVIDVGTDASPIYAGNAIRFDFDLKDAKTKDSKTYAQTWVRITNAESSRTWLATGLIRQPVGPSTLLYIFDTPGSYVLNVSFRDGNADEIASSSFPLTVAAVDSTPVSFNVVVFLVSLLVVLIGGFAVGRWFGSSRIVK